MTNARGIGRPQVSAAVFGLLALAACGPGLDERGAAAVNMQLMEADRAFAQDVAARRLDAWVEAFSDSGVMFRPGGTVRGHTAIRDLMSPVFADTSYRLEWEPVEAHGSPDGQLGYTVGRYVSRHRDSEGEIVESRGSYLSVWRLGADGVWRVVADIGNPDRQ